MEGGRGLTMDGGESTQKRMERMIRENPAVVLSRRSCCMGYVIKRLLGNVGVQAMVMELEGAEEEAASSFGPLPLLFIGGAPVGGLEGLMALHLSGMLVPMLQQVGALLG